MTGKLPTFSDMTTEQLTGRERSAANLRKGGGRPKGKPNKVNGDIKAMILGALSDAGGQDYLCRQAEDNPAAFMALVGKVVPRDVKTEINGALELVLSDRLKEARERAK